MNFNKTKKVSRFSYSDQFHTDVKTSPQMQRVKNFVEHYTLKGKNAAILERSKIRQTITNAKSEYDRIKRELSKGHGLAGDTIQMLQAREKELAMLMRKTLPKSMNNLVVIYEFD